MVWRSSNSRLQVAILAVLNVMLLVSFGVTRVVWNRLSHSPEVKFRFADRSTLYPGEPKLESVSRVGRNGLKFEFQNVKANELEVLQSGKRIERVISTVPGSFQIKLVPGEFEVDLVGSPLQLKLRFERSKSMQEAGYRQARADGYVTIAQSSVEVWSEDKTSVGGWGYKGGSSALPGSLSAINGTPEALIRGYGKWVLGKKGVPNDETQDASPEVTLANLDSGKSKGWCNNLSKGFLPLAARAGIVARQVGSHDLHLQDVWLGNHQLNEWFNPDLQKWQLVDFTLDIWSVSQNQTALDADQFSRVIKSGGQDSLRFAVKQSQRSMQWADLDPVLKNSIRDYYGRGQRFSYHLPGTPEEPRTVLVEDAQFSRVDTFQMFHVVRLLCVLAGILSIICTGLLLKLLVNLFKARRPLVGSQ